MRCSRGLNQFLLLCLVGVSLALSSPRAVAAADQPAGQPATPPATPPANDPFAALPGIPPPEFKPIDPARVGLSYWDAPPALMSPYDDSWFDFRAILWHTPPAKAEEQALTFDRLRDLYFTGGMAYSDSDPKPFSDARIPYYRTNVTNFLYLRNKSLGKKTELLKKERTHELLNREPSLEDVVTLDSESTRAEKIAKLDHPNRPLNYDLRDEASYTSFCNPIEFDFSAVSLKAFREWLKTQYADLPALNAEWQTTFATWDDVTPFMVNELRKREWQDKPDMATVNLAPCVDHRAYNNYLWYKTTSLYKAAIDKNDPGAPVGFSGTQMPSAWGGFDFDLFSRDMTWVEYYDICGSRQVLRGLCQEDMPMVAATAFSNRTFDTLRLWSNALSGDKGCLVWPYDDSKKAPENMRLYDVTQPAWPITEVGQNLAANLRELRCGVVPLLNKAVFQNDGIAILYHQPSITADWFFETKRDGASWVNRYGSWESGHNYMAAERVSFHKLIEDLGYQYTYARSEDVVKDRLAAHGIKVLVLVRNICLSDEEIAGLKRFVEGGGVIVNDLMTGRMDNHGVVRTDAGLKEINALLGVTRDVFAWEEERKEENDKGGYGDAYGYKMELKLAQDFGPWRDGSLQQIVGFHEEQMLAAPSSEGVAVSSGGDALVIAKHGKGKVVTLNFDIPNYRTDRNEARGSEVVSDAKVLFHHIFADLAGVKPVVTVTDARGHYPGRVETVHFADGLTHYLALCPNREVLIDWETLNDTAAGAQAQDPTRRVTIKLPAKRYVFDVRNRKALGLTDSVQGDLPSFRPLIYALLPYQVDKLTVESSGKLDASKHLAVKLTLTAEPGAKLGNHVVHARLLDAQGNEIPEGVINLPLPGGSYEGALDFSYVKAKGPFKLTLWDVTSAAEASIDLTE